MIRLMLGLMFVGGFLVFLGYKELSLASSADDEPQTITAADLIANGPGENAHVIVTDLFIMDDGIIESYEDSPDRFTKIWVPACSMDEPWIGDYLRVVEFAYESNPSDPDFSSMNNVDMPTDFRLLIISDEVESEGEMDEFVRGEVVQGLIVNGVNLIGQENMDLLREKYPDADEGNVLILEHNRAPASMGKVLLFFVGGFALLLVGPGVFFIARRRAINSAAIESITYLKKLVFMARGRSCCKMVAGSGLKI